MIKKLLRAAMLAVAASAFLVAPAFADGHKADPVAKALLKIEAELLGALVRGDAAAFERRLADGFSMIGPDGAVQSRAELLADIRTGALKMDSSANDEMKVQVFAHAAVVTYRSTDKGTYKGADISGQYRWTDVFVKKGPNWLIVATQVTPIPKK